MTNWQKFKILGMNPKENSEMYGFSCFRLDKYYECINSTEKTNYIFCVWGYPFNTWEIGDYLEIDLDKTRNYERNYHFNDTTVVRKYGEAVSSSTNIITTRGSSSDMLISPGAVSAMRNPRTMEIARDMSRIVDETGKEVEFKIEDANSNLKYSLILRKQN